MSYKEPGKTLTTQRMTYLFIPWLNISQKNCKKDSNSEVIQLAIQSIKKYCKDGGSTVYTCSLGTEGASDAIPHCILFQKAMGVFPDRYWHIMIN